MTREREAWRGIHPSSQPRIPGRRPVTRTAFARRARAKVMLLRVAADDPISYRSLEAGTPVISADGDEVGTVEHVLADEEADIFDGIVIDVRLGPGGLHFVDATQVAELRETGVVLTLPGADVEHLPKPQPNPAVLAHHGADDSESQLEQKLRRAWGFS